MVYVWRAWGQVLSPQMLKGSGAAPHEVAQGFLLGVYGSLFPSPLSNPRDWEQRT